MKATKLISALGIGLITFWACEKEPETTAPDIELELTPEEELMGTWDARFLEWKSTITTNIDQTTLDRNSEGEGAIEVTGADTATLTYMVGVWRDDYGTSVTVSNQPSSTWEYPIYRLSCSRYDWGSYCDLWIEERYDYRSYSGYEVDFSLDLETYTLDLDGVALYGWEGETVIVTGTLTGGMLVLPANTPTVMYQFTDDDPDNSLKFKENDIFLWVFEDQYFNSGYWELDDDTLTLYVGTEFGEVNHFTYSLSGDSLTLEWEEDVCSWAGEDSTEYAFCLEDYERSYGLDEGSLASIVNHIIIKYSRSGDEQLARELEEIEGLERRSIRTFLHELEKKEGGHIPNIR